MAYENKPKVIRDKDKDRSAESQASLDRQRATRARRAEEKRVKDLRKEALDQASGTKERREVKAADEGELLAMLGRQSQEGNIYDVETGDYDPAFNKEGTDETISNDGIDQFGTDEEEDKVGSFNAIICVDGKPFNATINGSIGSEITD
jgi:hypothetical protein